MAIFILGIGVISIAALFPAGIAQQRRSIDDVMGPIVAHNAMSILRSKLRQEDFGTFEQFSLPPQVLRAPRQTIPGDWPWLRPSTLFDDENETPLDETGAIDVFSHVWTRRGGADDRATEFGSGYEDENGTNSFPTLYGIPYARRLAQGNQPVPPLVLITQQERYAPQASQLIDDDNLAPPRPEYVWDCMFRRFNGRVEVAVFVYRVRNPGGEPAPYVVAANPTDPRVPPLPVALDLRQNGPMWNAYGERLNDPSDDAFVPGTDPGAPFDPLNDAQAWQLSGQWILDQNDNVHRVLAGRQAAKDGPVELVRPVPRLYPAFDGFGNPYPDIYFYDRRPPTGRTGQQNIVTDIWFLPARDQAGRRLTPVYVMVQVL